MPGDVVPDRPQARRPQNLRGLGVDPGLTSLRRPHAGESSGRLYVESLEGTKIEGGDDPGLAAVELVEGQRIDLLVSSSLLFSLVVPLCCFLQVI